MSDSVSVVLLNAEGDQFNASFVADGKAGGERASECFYTLAKDRLVKREGQETNLVVYLVADRASDSAIPEKRIEAFYEGFASAGKLSFVVEPIDSSPSCRIEQILDLYLPLESTSSILLGSLHDNSLYSYVIGLPPQHKNKLTLISTINVAPCYRQLVNEGWFKASTEFESLFGELPTSLNGVDVPSMRRASVQLGICAEEDSSKETASKTKTNPVTPSSKDPQEAWDDERDSDEDFATWNPKAQPRFSPPPSPQRSPSPLELPPLNPKSIAASPVAQKPPTSSPSNLLEPDDPFPALPSRPFATLPPKPIITSVSSQPLPIRPIALPPKKLVPLKKVEVITQTPQGPVSSLPSFHVPTLSFSAFTQPCKRYYLSPTGCPQSAQSCRFSHSFPFSPYEKQYFPLWSKGTVCMDAMRGKCLKGEECHQGHRCNWTVKQCPFGDSCKFKVRGLPHSSRA
ncbi:hypothetical protein JCM16303_003112 [Sporobolomyces ruberrimus]